MEERRQQRSAPEPIVDAPRARCYAEDIDRIASLLRKNGALAVILIDASSLEIIERRYGVAAYRGSSAKLAAVVDETCRKELGSDDLVATVNSGGDEIMIMLFRPRADEVFYRDLLPTLASTLAAKLAEQGSRLVYPYGRDAPVLSVGNAFTFYNPGLREERQVREAIDRARVDSELNGRIVSRVNSTAFTNLHLAEDVLRNPS